MAVTSREQSHTEQKLLGITDPIDQAYKLRGGGMGDDSKASALTYIFGSAGLSVFERTMT